jgi:hypothetical protein
MIFCIFVGNCWSSEIWCLDGLSSSRFVAPVVNSPIIPYIMADQFRATLTDLDTVDVLIFLAFHQ